jgi:Uma2 family endonuclease
MVVSMAVQIQRWQFTVDDYARMLETGILSEDDRVELIDGEVRAMSPIGSVHAAIVKRLIAILTRLLGDSAIVSVQDPIRLNDYTEPEPDVAVLRLRDDYYAQGHPHPDNVLLVIEVADTSLDYDRDEKLPRYAAANLVETWLIDVAGQTVEQYWQPRNGKYLLKRLVERGDTIVAQSLPNLQIVVDRVFE